MRYYHTCNILVLFVQLNFFSEINQFTEEADSNKNYSFGGCKTISCGPDIQNHADYVEALLKVFEYYYYRRKTCTLCRFANGNEINSRRIIQYKYLYFVSILVKYFKYLILVDRKNNITFLGRTT